MNFRTAFTSILFLVFICSINLLAQTQPEVFNASVYQGIYPDIMNGYGTAQGATNHWLNFGLPAGRRASIIFDPAYYLQHNPDLLAAFGPTGYSAALQHFINQGLPNEGRRGSLEFDVKYYLARYSDLAAAYGTNYLAAADHFLNTGLPQEGRQGSANFSVQDYINMYPDVSAGYVSSPTRFTDSTLHWLRRGKGLGRHGFGTFAALTECGASPTTQTTEFYAIPAASPFNITITRADTITADVSVTYTHPPQGFSAQLTRLTTDPSPNPPPQGSYFVATSGANKGVYKFNPADAEQSIQIVYTLTPTPANFARIFFTHRTDGQAGHGTYSDPFDAATINDPVLNVNNLVLDDTLRHITEQTSGKVPINQDTGLPYAATNLIVCLDNGTYSTRGNWDWLIGAGHTKGDPDNPQNPTHPLPGGFTLNQNWHVHGKGMNSTFVQLYDFVPNPSAWSFPSGTGLGLAFGTRDPNSSGVEISDLSIDGNYAALHNSAAQQGISKLNLLAINLRANGGGHRVHNVNVISSAGEVANIDEKFEAFPVHLTSDNVSPDLDGNNIVEFVLMSGFAGGHCTGIDVDNVAAEIRYNVVNGYENGLGGFNMPLVWWHDNFSFNSLVNGFITDSLANRNVLLQFNQFINPAVRGILIGGAQTYDFFQLQYNIINLSQNNTTGILFNGNVTGATVINNNIITTVAPTGVKGIAFGGFGNFGSQFEFNQISSRFSNQAVPAGNCAFNNWNESSVQLSNFPNTQSSTCTTLPAPGMMASFVDPATNSLDVYYPAADFDVHQLARNSSGQWHSFDVSFETKSPNDPGTLSGIYDTATGAADLVFVSSNGHVTEQEWNSSSGWGMFDLTTLSSAPPASGSFGQIDYLMDPFDNFPEAYYVGTDQHVHQLIGHFGLGWLHNDLTNATTATLTDPNGGLTILADRTLTNSLQLFYVGSDFDVHQLYAPSGSNWNTFDVSAFTGAPPAQPGQAITGVINPYAVNGDLEIFYVGTDQHVHQLVWNPSFGWATNDISALVGAPVASQSAQLSSVVDSLSRFLQVYYVGTDQHIHQLGWNPNGWFTFDLTSITGATPALSATGLTSLIDSLNNSLEIYYEATDGHVHQISWTSTASWQTQDITAAVQQ